MAQVQISQLPTASALTGFELVPIVQNGVTSQTTTGAISPTSGASLTFLTLTNQPTLTSSRNLVVSTGLLGVDGGPQNPYTISLANTGVTAGTYTFPTIVVNAQGQITSVSSNPTEISTISFGSTGLTPNTPTSGAITVAGTLNVSNGGTGITSLTAGYIPYGNGTSALASNSGFTFTGTSLTAPTLVVNSTINTTPNLTFNASNSGFTSGANIANSYLQTVIQNKSGTSGASTNYVLSNDLGTDSSYYGEFGMNSSGYTASGTFADFFSINNGIYFSGHDGDISVGSGNGYKTYLTWGTSGQSAHVINATGAIGLSTNLGTSAATTGTSGFGTSGYLMQTNGSAAAPTWVAPSGLSVGTATNIAGGAAGSLPYQTGAGATSLLALGTTGYFLTAGASAPQWTQTLPVANGGTGLTSFTSGGAVYASSTSALTTGTLPVSAGGTGGSTASITLFNNITGFTAAGTTGTTSTNLVFSTSPTLVTPVLGTPTSVTLTNATGLPLTTGVTGTLSASNGGTGVSNNAASTITISGNYGSTFVVSGAYSYTFPAATDTLVNLGSAQTLTSKTLTNPTITNYTETLYAIGNSSTAVTISLANGTYQTVTMTGNCTFTMPSVGAGKSFVLQVNSGTGTFTGTFTSVKWPNNTSPTLTTTASRWDILAFFSDGTNWYGNYVQAFQ